MPRHKRVKVRAVARTPHEARTEVRAIIDELLGAANKHIANRWHADDDDQRRHEAETFYRVLTCLHDRVNLRFSGMPPWAWLGFTNLQAMIRRGGHYLMRCAECQRWELTGDKRQIRCRRVACRNAAARRDMANARRREREREMRPPGRGFPRRKR